jgi:hypothetical protein
VLLSCTVTNAAGTVSATATANCSIVPAPPPLVIPEQPLDQIATAGAQATFTLPQGVVDGTSPYSYQWYENGLPIPGANGASYTTPALTMHDNGSKFMVFVNNQITSNPAALHVTTTVNGSQTWQIYTNETTLYPSNQSISIQSLTPLPNGTGAEVTLSTASLPTNYSLQYFVGSVPSPTNSYPFPSTGTIDIDFGSYLTSAVSVTAEVSFTVASQAQTLSVKWMSPQAYAASGRTAQGLVALQSTTIPFAGSNVADWIIDQPSAADISFAQATWGPLISGTATPTANAQNLAMSIMDALEAARGVPSNAMNSATWFEQYQLAIANPANNQVWCTNIAGIFNHACNCLGIPARNIAVGMPTETLPSFNLYTGNAHSTVEIFDSQLNRWIWMDPTLYILEMDLDAATNNYALEAADMVRYLADPIYVAKLAALEYTPGPFVQNGQPGAGIVALAAVDPTGNDPKHDVCQFYTPASTIQIPSLALTSPVHQPRTLVDYFTNEPILFPVYQPIAIASIVPFSITDPTEPGNLLQGFNLNLTSPNDYPIQYTQTYNSNLSDPNIPLLSWMWITATSIPVQFSNLNGSSQGLVYKIRQSDGNQVLAEPWFSVLCDTSGVYVENSQNNQGSMLFINRGGQGIPYYHSNTSDWIIDQPPAADIGFALSTWGSLISSGSSPTANAQTLATAILNALEGLQGIPSAAMVAAPPFEQYQMAIQGQGLVGREMIDGIFSHACNALGIPARSWDLGNRQYPGNYTFALTPAHMTTEIFDALCNRWVWMDPALNCLGAQFADYGYMDLLNFTRCLDLLGKSSFTTLMQYQSGQAAIPTILTTSNLYPELQRLFADPQLFQVNRNPSLSPPQL